MGNMGTDNVARSIERRVILRMSSDSHSQKGVHMFEACASRYGRVP